MNNQLDLAEVNQKLDMILEYQERQTRLARMRFWISFAFFLVFVLLPLILLPFMISKVFSIYSGMLNPEDLEAARESAQGVLDLLK